MSTLAPLVGVFLGAFVVWAAIRLHQKKSRKFLVPNSVWILKCDGQKGPWAKKISVHETSTVIDVKDGWVRYKIGTGQIYNDERLRITSFLLMYTPYDVPKA